MANHASAEKRIRRNERRRNVNRSRMGRIRTFIKKIELALGNQDADAASAAFKTAQPELQRGVSKGIIHKNTAARKLSRLSSRIKALAGSKK